MGHRQGQEEVTRNVGQGPFPLNSLWAVIILLELCTELGRMRVQVSCRLTSTVLFYRIFTELVEIYLHNLRAG